MYRRQFEKGGGLIVGRKHRNAVYDGAPYMSASDIKASILALRVIYNTLDDMEFAVMYQKKYGVKKEVVLRVIDDTRTQGVEKFSHHGLERIGGR